MEQSVAPSGLPTPEKRTIGMWPTAHKNCSWNAGRGHAKINGIGDELDPLPIVLSAGVATAAGIGTWGAVGPSSELFGPTVRHTASVEALALTFDDGPNPAVTPKLLDLFDRHSVRVTFFLIGKFARACPDLVREISARGHLLGNHTETHANLIFQSRTGIREELEQCQVAISAATRADPPRCMRPPYGIGSRSLPSV